MAIDLSEDLRSFADVPDLLPRRTGGRRVHVSAVYRWASRGIRGVRLEWVQVGGIRYTSREALDRFVAALSGAAPADAAAARECAAAGF
jgi:hypothetical protein